MAGLTMQELAAEIQRRNITDQVNTDCELWRRVSDATCTNYEEMTNPYPNEHAARIQEPGQFEKFRRADDKFGEGIHAIYGIESDIATLQSIHFDADKFTPDEAQKWLNMHEHDYILFEKSRNESPDTEDSNMAEDQNTNSSSGPDIATLNLEALVEKNPEVRRLVEQSENNLKMLTELKEQVTALEEAKNQLEEIKKADRENAVNALKELTDKFTDEQLEKMNSDEIKRLVDVLGEAAGSNAGTPKPIPAPKGKHTGKDEKSVEEQWNAIIERGNALDEQREDGTWYRPGVDEK